MELYGIYAHAGDLILVRFQKWVKFFIFFILKGEMIMEKTMQHGEVYTCRRLRLLSYLKEHGRLPFETIPDVRNPLYNVWRFRNDAELEQLINNYFAEIEANKE